MMNLKRRGMLWAVSALLLCSLLKPGWTAAATHLFSAKVAVASEDDRLRPAAVQEALSEVILKLTGRAIDQIPQLHKQPMPAMQWMDSYAYEEADGKLYLKVFFDDKAFKKQLNTLNISIWGADRPLLAVFVAYDNGTSQQVLSNSSLEDQQSDSSRRDLLTELKVEMERYGIPYVFPLMDISDMAKLSFTDIKNFNIDAVSGYAKQRYGANGVLLAVIKQTPDTMHSQWELSIDNEKMQWFGQGSLEYNITNAIGVFGKGLAQYYALDATPMENQTVFVSVEKVTSRSQYREMLTALQKLPMVRMVEVASIEPDGVLYKLKFNSSVDKLMQAIGMDQNLEFVAQSSLENAVWIRYRWKL